MKTEPATTKFPTRSFFEWGCAFLGLMFIARLVQTFLTVDGALAQVPPATKPVQPEQDDADSKIKRELLVTEYEHCLDRYENLYKALWQNLSYLSVLSAAIVTFASAKFDWRLVAIIAGAPLLFWYLAQFRPLDMYGRIARSRSAEIERILNALHFSPVETKVIAPGHSVQVKLDHWIRYAGGEPRRPTLGWLLAGPFRVFRDDSATVQKPVSVRTRMRYVFCVLMLFWLGVLVDAVYEVECCHLVLVKPAASELTLKPGDATMKVEITSKR